MLISTRSWKVVLSTLVLLLLLKVHEVHLIEPLTTAIGAVGALTGVYFNWDKAKELTGYEEGCNYDKWVHRNPDLSWLNDKIFGQNIALETVKRVVLQHLRKDKPYKALVLSFHGYTGIGKTHLAKLIAASIYPSFNLTGESKFVHFIVSTSHLNNMHLIEGKQKLKEKIENAMYHCDRSMFIIDEVDKYPERFLDVLVPYIEKGTENKINYNRAIYILIGNGGGSVINQKTHQLRSLGIQRSEIQYSDFESTLDAESFLHGGLKNSDLVARAMIDAFVPFMPLEREHVRECTVAYLKEQHHWSDSRIAAESKLIDKIVNDMQYVTDTGLYARYGCKRVISRVDSLV